MTIAIFAAMEPELTACPEWSRSGKPRVIEGSTVFDGDGALVCQTGIGRERAIESAAAVLSAVSVTAVVSVGLCGGLAPGVAVGEVVACTHVDHEEHRFGDTEQSVYADRSLLGAALEIGEQSRLPFRTGTSLTVDEAAWGPAEKAAHHAWKAHDIVEMESFWIAEAASRRGLPFLAVRSVSDAAMDTLPNLSVMRPDGTLDAQKFIEYLREHPEYGDYLSGVAQKSKAALDNLARYLDVLLPRLVEVTTAHTR